MKPRDITNFASRAITEFSCTNEQCSECKNVKKFNISESNSFIEEKKDIPYTGEKFRQGTFGNDNFKLGNSDNDNLKISFVYLPEVTKIKRFEIVPS